MLLQKEICQKIIDRFINILDNNINIMDLEGKIIASTNKNRVETFHKGAQLCVLSRKELVITKANQPLYKGCEPGINLPIYYEDEIVGIVGITGEPEEIKGYTRVVKELVELIVAESEQRKYTALKEETKRSFFIQLFNEHGSIQEEALQSRTHIVDFDFRGAKRIILLEISELEEGLKDEKSPLEKQEQKNRLITYIRTRLQIGENVIDLYEDEIILILNESILSFESRASNESSETDSFLKKIKEELEGYYQIRLRIYIGELCRRLSDYPKHYKKIKRLTDLYRNKEVNRSILRVREYKLDLMLDTLPQDEKEYYLNTFGSVFGENQKDESYYELLETIKVYFESDMSGTHAAQKMNVHRNTVRYRINKFKDLYDVDVTKPYTCMKIYLALKLFLG